MPLFDHFHPPLYPHHHWESFHSNWATRIADGIAALLPPDFQVEEHTHAGVGFEIDVAAYQEQASAVNTASGGAAASGAAASGAAVATLAAPAYAPPVPDHTIPAAFPDTFEVRVFNTAAGLTLVGVIELVSPANKDRPAERLAFVTKCASYLAQGVSLIVMDVVTNRHANLHNEIMRVMEAGEDLTLPDNVHLYATAYRPAVRGEKDELDMWLRPLALGAPLPTMPLRLIGDLFVPVDFEAAYLEAYRRRRLPELSLFGAANE
ncbi:MAG: DUF4058 family protein [Gemmataceae bacterium]|nr:DUF4058 family protein [Gemmataceae bacterium]